MTLFSNTLKTAKSISYNGALLAALFTSAFTATQVKAEAMTSTPQASESVGTANFEAMYISKAKTKKTDIKTRIGYTNWQVLLGSLEREGESTRTSLDAGFRSSNLMWENSPYFAKDNRYNFFVQGQHHFNLDLPVELHASAKIETDLQARQICKYSMGQFTVWASKEIEAHNVSLGLYKEIGRRSHTLLPVLGLQTALGEGFDLDIMFPFYAKVAYKVNDAYKVYAGVTYFSDRQRTQPSDDATFSKSIWQFRSNLAHIGASYRYMDMATANIEIGRSMDSSVHIYDTEGHKKAFHKVDGGVYSQISLSVWF